MSYEPIDDPRAPIRGEMPYQAPNESIFTRINKKLGPRNIRGIIGALTMPEGLIDQSGQRQGPSPFQAGLLGFQKGTDTYDAMQQALEAKQLQLGMQATDVESRQRQAAAAEDRAAAYGRWADRPTSVTMTPAQRNQSRLDWWNSLSPEEKRAATAGGIAPYPPRSGAGSSNEDDLVVALKARYPQMLDEDARILARTKPTVLGSTQNYDMSKKGVLLQRTQRNFGVPLPARQVLAKYGIPENDWYGLIGSADENAAYPYGPTSKAEIDMMEGTDEDMGKLEDWYNDPTLNPIQRQWVIEKLNEFAAEDSTGTGQ